MPVKFQSVPTADVVFSEGLVAGLPVINVSINNAPAVLYAQGAINPDGTINFTAVSPNPLVGLSPLDISAAAEDEVMVVSTPDAAGDKATCSLVIDGTKFPVFEFQGDGSPTKAIPISFEGSPAVADFAFYDDGNLVLAGYARPGATRNGVPSGGVSGAPG